MACDGSNGEVQLPAELVEEPTEAPSSTWTKKEVVCSNGGADVGEDPPGCPTAGDLMGRHRLSAAVSRLEQEIQSLQAELEEVERRLRPSSAACEEVVAAVERAPDGLLPTTRGPEDVSWDRWFQPVHGGRSERSRSGGGGGGRGYGAGRRWWAQGRRFLPSSAGQDRVQLPLK